MTAFVERWLTLSRWTHKRNGRRRTLLSLVGTIWILVGWSIWTSPVPNWQFGHLPSLLDKILEDKWSAILWFICGLIAVSVGVLPRKRFPDACGFDALLVPSVLWTVLYAWSWVIFVVTRGHWGNPRSWSMALTWLFAVTVVYITSGWPDPSDREK